MSVRDEQFGVNDPYRKDVDTEEILALKEAVVEAAIARRAEQKRELISMAGVELCSQEDDAVDALIAAREKVDRPYNKMPPGVPYCVDHDESHTDCAIAARQQVEEKQ